MEYDIDDIDATPINRSSSEWSNGWALIGRNELIALLRVLGRKDLDEGERNKLVNDMIEALED